MAHPVVIDLETQHTFREFSDPADLKISVIGVYDYSNEKLQVIEEKDILQLFPILEKASVIIGFNIISFDLPVLQPYYSGNVLKLPRFDILEDIRALLGHRLSLNDLATATLGLKKSGHGLQAIEFYKAGKMRELKAYCADDVKITKELFDFGVKNKYVNFPSTAGVEKIFVDWGNVEPKNLDVNMTLRF